MSTFSIVVLVLCVTFFNLFIWDLYLTTERFKNVFLQYFYLVVIFCISVVSIWCLTFVR